MIKSKSPIGIDWRNCIVHVGDTILVREPFPRTSVLKIGQVEKIRCNDKGSYDYKLVKGKWYSNPLKLADK